MAVTLLQDQDEQNKNNQQAGAVQSPGEAPAVPEAGAAGQVTPAGQPQQQQAQQANRSKTGSGFQNLQTVLNANRQNRLGQTIQSGVQQQAQQAKTGLQQAQQKFQEHAEAGKVGTEQDIQARNEAISRIQGYQAPPAGQAEGQAPASPLVSQQDIEQFQKFRSGQYQGPQGLENYQDLAGQSAKAEQLGKLTTSTGGQKELLRQFVGSRPDYSSGKRSLDALILGQTGGQQLRQAKQGTQNLLSKVQGAERTAGEIAKTQSGLAQQFGKETREMLGEGGTDAETGSGLIGEISKSLYGDLATREEQAKTDYEGFKGRLANKELTQEDVDKYIKPLISSGEITESSALFGLTPEDLDKAFAQGKFGLENVADQTRATKLAALQQLAGREDIKLDPTKIGQAGESIATDVDRFGDQYRTAQEQYLKDIAPLEELLGQATNRQEYLAKGISSIDDLVSKIGTPVSQATYEQSLSGEGPALQEGQVSIEQYAKNIEDAYKQLYADPNLAPYMEYIKPRLDQQKAALEGYSQNIGTTNYDPEQAQAIAASADLELKNILNDLRSPTNTREQAQIDRIKAQIAAKQQEYGGAGSILDLMSEAERQKLRDRTINPTERLQQEGLASLLGQTAYEAEINKLLSDKKLKKNIKSASKQVQSFLDKLKPYEYEYKNPEHGKGKYLGIMAQDLLKSDLGKAAIEETKEGKKVNFGKLAGTLVASQAQLNERIKRLEKSKKK